MQNTWLPKLTAILKYASAIGAAIYILMYIVVALLRISYPFELEWIEGLAVDHVARILAGQPMYVAPSIEFASSIYTPLYYYISAGASALLGGGFLPLRLVSFLASLGSMALLYAFVRRETKNRYAGLIAAGLFAATYRLGGAFFDLARVDSLFLLLLLAAVYVLRFCPNRRGFVLAAVLATFSFLTKQTALLAAVFFIIYAVKMRREGGLWFVGTFLALSGAAVLVLNRIYDGWFVFYVFEVPAGHTVMKLQFLKFFVQDILRPLPLASLLVLFFLTVRWMEGAKRDVWFYLLMGMGFFAAAGAPRVKDGNYDNDLIPAYAFIALLFGIAVPAIRAWGRHLFESLPAEDAQRTRTVPLLSVFFFALITTQLVILFYGPQNQIPTAKDRAAGYALVEELRQMPGEVWLGCHGYLPTLAGKRTYATAMPIYDILAAHNEKAKAELLKSIEQALAERRFSAVITDDDEFLAMDKRTDYVEKPMTYAAKDAFWPVTGYHTRPSKLYLPKEAANLVP